jgi:hypothetical protein
MVLSICEIEGVAGSERSADVSTVFDVTWILDTRGVSGAASMTPGLGAQIRLLAVGDDTAV